MTGNRSHVVRRRHTAIGSELTRRAVLRAGVGWAAVPTVAAVAWADQAQLEADRTLVLLHLSGGNDGLNTVIPYADPLYYGLRPHLSCVAREVLPITGRIGLHPSLSALVPLLRQGKLAIVQGVGYPDPDYSHVGSCRIWATGQINTDSPKGWWDRALQVLPQCSTVGAVCVGARSPVMMATTVSAWIKLPGERAPGPSLAANPLEYQPGRIHQTLAAIARLLASSRVPRLVFASVGGFDTHTDQLAQHAQVLEELGNGLATFQSEIEERNLAERIVLMGWSEFGRRPAENATGGTDHGSAGPVFLMGRKVRGGLYGRMPSLEHTDFGNLIPTVDFRTVYAELAEQWLGYPADPTAGRPPFLGIVKWPTGDVLS